MNVRDLMTSPVHTIGPKAPAWEGVGLMRSHRIRRLPVVEDGRLIGIVTWTDLVRVRPPAIGGRWTIPQMVAGVLVRHLMTPDPVTVGPETAVEDAAALMRRRKVGGLPVVEDGRLVGIVTESDLFEAFIGLFAIGPHEIQVRIPLTSIIVEVPRLVAELTRAGVSILSLQTSRFHGNESVTLVVREQDAALAREVIRAQSLGLEGKRPFDRQKEG